MRSRDYQFRVRHPEKQRLILKALNEMRTESETPQESSIISGLIADLESLLEQRKRLRKPLKKKNMLLSGRLTR